MGAEVYFWWMIVAFSGEPVVIPVPYQTQQMCQWAADEAGRGRFIVCIPQPAADVAEFSATWAMPRADVCEVPAP